MPVKYESGAVEKVEEDLCGVTAVQGWGNLNTSFSAGICQNLSNQDFAQIKSSCLAEGKLFEDPLFNFNLGIEKQVEWKRPSEICPNPQFLVQGQSRFDVKQGGLGDCWLVAAIGNLTLYKNLFSQVVPHDQSFNKDYAGVFHFRFWQNGRRVDVVVDDRLPTHQGKLLFLHSSENNEFWSALLEKAYAKMYGSYAGINAGNWPARALETFTGGVAESFDINRNILNFYKYLVQAFQRNSVMSAIINNQQTGWHKANPNLPNYHAYTITGVRYVDAPTQDGRVLRWRLLRIRNPWGNTVEWKGRWGDSSPEWGYLTQSQKTELGLTVNDDGEFWMCYVDFLEHFNRVDICHWNSYAMGGVCSKQWESSVFEGGWGGVRASYCEKQPESSSRSPQYTVTLTDPDEDDDENKCTLIVALSETSRPQAALTTHAIGFSVYKLPDNKPVSLPVDVNSFNDDECVGRCHDLTRLRKATARFELEPGTYVIVPSTAEDQEGEFLLRVFSEKANNMAEHGRDMHYAGDRVEDVVAKTEPAGTVTVSE